MGKYIIDFQYFYFFKRVRLFFGFSAHFWSTNTQFFQVMPTPFSIPALMIVTYKLIRMLFESTITDKLELKDNSVA